VPHRVPVAGVRIVRIVRIRTHAATSRRHTHPQGVLGVEGASPSPLTATGSPSGAPPQGGVRGAGGVGGAGVWAGGELDPEPPADPGSGWRPSGPCPPEDDFAPDGGGPVPCGSPFLSTVRYGRRASSFFGPIPLTCNRSSTL